MTSKRDALIALEKAVAAGKYNRPFPYQPKRYIDFLNDMEAAGVELFPLRNLIDALVDNRADAIIRALIAGCE